MCYKEKCDIVLHKVCINLSHPGWELKCFYEGGIVRNLWLVIFRWTGDKFYTYRPSSKKKRWSTELSLYREFESQMAVVELYE